jgi:hypothetical protein
MHLSGSYYANGLKQYIHRVKAEKALGKPLPEGAVVHHADGDPLNNENSNLVICPNQSYHHHLHHRLRVMEAGGDPDKDKWCSHHDTYHSKGEFSSNSSSKNIDGLHNMCREATNETRRGKGYGEFGWKERMQQQYRRAKAKGLVWDLKH